MPKRVTSPPAARSASGATSIASEVADPVRIKIRCWFLRKRKCNQSKPLAIGLNCGLSKLSILSLEQYSTLLYIDADCLVVQDVSHLLDVGLQDDERKGLLAASADIRALNVGIDRTAKGPALQSPFHRHARNATHVRL